MENGSILSPITLCDQVHVSFMAVVKGDICDLMFTIGDRSLPRATGSLRAGFPADAVKILQNKTFVLIW